MPFDTRNPEAYLEITAMVMDVILLVEFIVYIASLKSHTTHVRNLSMAIGMLTAMEPTRRKPNTTRDSGDERLPLLAPGR